MTRASRVVRLGGSPDTAAAFDTVGMSWMSACTAFHELSINTRQNDRIAGSSCLFCNPEILSKTINRTQYQLDDFANRTVTFGFSLLSPFNSFTPGLVRRRARIQRALADFVISVSPSSLTAREGEII